MHKVEKIIDFFKQHKKYPFSQYYCNYNEYCAARLMILNLTKAYIPKEQLDDWKFSSNYYDARRNDPEIFYSLISCINHTREQVFFFTITDDRENNEESNNVIINVERDDFYGEKWREDAPKEDWYSVFQITLNINDLNDYNTVNAVLEKYFNEKLNFDELSKLKETIIEQ